jgi:hypothetical protein
MTQPDSAPPPDTYPDAWKPSHIRKAEVEAEANADPTAGLRNVHGGPAVPPEPPAEYPSNWISPKGQR